MSTLKVFTWRDDGRGTLFIQIKAGDEINEREFGVGVMSFSFFFYSMGSTAVNAFYV